MTYHCLRQAVAHGSILENELRRIDQCPQQILDGFAAFVACFVEDSGGGVILFIGWLARIGNELQLFDDLAVRAVAGGKLCRAAVVVGELALQVLGVH